MLSLGITVRGRRIPLFSKGISTLGGHFRGCFGTKRSLVQIQSARLGLRLAPTFDLPKPGVFSVAFVPLLLILSENGKPTTANPQTLAGAIQVLLAVRVGETTVFESGHFAASHARRHLAQVSECARVVTKRSPV